MSVHRFPVNLSAEAQMDYDDILLYGLLNCGNQKVERHVIYYRVDANAVQIIRIIHERSDAAPRLPR